MKVTISPKVIHKLMNDYQQEFEKNKGKFEQIDSKGTINAKRLAEELGVPLIPKRPKPPEEVNPVVAVCEECGRPVRQIEHYYCANENCPLKPHVTL